MRDGITLEIGYLVSVRDLILLCMYKQILPSLTQCLVKSKVYYVYTMMTYQIENILLVNHDQPNGKDTTCIPWWPGRFLKSISQRLNCTISLNDCSSIALFWFYLRRAYLHISLSNIVMKLATHGKQNRDTCIYRYFYL